MRVSPSHTVNPPSMSLRQRCIWSGRWVIGLQGQLESRSGWTSRLIPKHSRDSKISERGKGRGFDIGKAIWIKERTYLSANRSTYGGLRSKTLPKCLLDRMTQHQKESRPTLRSSAISPSRRFSGFVHYFWFWIGARNKLEKLYERTAQLKY